MNRNPDRQTRTSRRRQSQDEVPYSAPSTPQNDALSPYDEPPPGVDPLSAYDDYPGYKPAPAEQQGDAYADNDGQPRRRRSQASRMRTSSIDDTITPSSATGKALEREMDAERRYARPDARRAGAQDPYAPPARGEEQRQPPAPPARGNARYSASYDDPDDGYVQRDSLYEDYDDEEEQEPRRRGYIKWIIIGVILAALIGGGTYLGLQRPDLIAPIIQWGRERIMGPDPTPSPSPEPTPDPVPTQAPILDASAAQVIEFAAEPAIQSDVTQPVLFYIRTTAQTDRIQIINDNGQILVSGAEGDYADNNDGRIWTMRVYFDEPYEGNVEATPGNESGWNDTKGSIISIKVGDPTVVTPTPTPDLFSNINSGAQTPAPDPDTGNETVTSDPAMGETVTDGSAMGNATQADASRAVPVSVEAQAYGSGTAVESFSRSQAITFGNASAYVSEEGMRGVLAYRGSNMRQNAAYGYVTPSQNILEEVWTAPIGVLGSVDTHGVQPIIVQWHTEARKMMALDPVKVEQSGFKEVFFSSSDGYLYCYDLSDGSATREPISIGRTPTPSLSTPSVYPWGVPLLAVGSGQPGEDATAINNGMCFFDLRDNTYIGNLTDAYGQGLSTDSSFVTSALIDNMTDTSTFIGGNGLLFVLQLGTNLDTAVAPHMIAAEVIDVYRSGTENDDTRVESSYAAYGENVYYATLGGLLQCVNINTFQPVWTLNVGVATKATIALRETESGVVLYHAGQADATGYTYLRCIDGQTGAVVWEESKAGTVGASPLVGTGALEGKVFFTVEDPFTGGGTLYAINADTGAVLWEYALMGANLSSPLALYDETGKAWIVQGDERGLLLFDAVQGSLLSQLALNGTIYGSPVAFDDRIVVATDAGQLYCVAVR